MTSRSWAIFQRLAIKIDCYYLFYFFKFNFTSRN